MTNGTPARTCADCNLSVASACPYKGALERGYLCPVVNKTCFLAEWTDGNCYACPNWNDFWGCIYRGDMTLMGRLITALRCRINAPGTHGTQARRVPADFMEV